MSGVVGGTARRCVTHPAAVAARCQQSSFAHVGADPEWSANVRHRRWHAGDRTPPVPAGLVPAVSERVGDDVCRLRALMDDELAEWSV